MDGGPGRLAPVSWPVLPVGYSQSGSAFALAGFAGFFATPVSRVAAVDGALSAGLTTAAVVPESGLQPVRCKQTGSSAANTAVTFIEFSIRGFEFSVSGDWQRGLYRFGAFP
jgi:hypothetical protein